MSTAVQIVPDIRLKRKVADLSGSSPGKCMQCGTCTAVCSLAPVEKPFPRKEMLWAAWGLEDHLRGNVDLWLCHQCGDCSSHCPRGVAPSDVLSALRQLNYRHYAVPRILGRIVNEPGWLPVALLLPVAVIAVILSLAGTFKIPPGPVDYSTFFPHAWLNATFSAITLLFYLLACVGIARFWKDMKRMTPPGPDRPSMPFFRVLKEIFSHTGFAGCGTRSQGKWAHLLVFYGFVLLIVVTVFAIVASMTHNYPLSLTNPFKLLGNIASLMIYSGMGIMISQRLHNRRVFGKSGYTDWLPIVAIAFLTFSGTLVELARFGNWSIAYHLYYIHLVAVWFVIMYLPFTKLGHIFYRTTALLYARSIGRK